MKRQNRQQPRCDAEIGRPGAWHLCNRPAKYKCVIVWPHRSTLYFCEKHISHGKALEEIGRQVQITKLDRQAPSAVCSRCGLEVLLPVVGKAGQVCPYCKTHLAV